MLIGKTFLWLGSSGAQYVFGASPPRDILQNTEEALVTSVKDTKDT